ncbi:MAG: bifunctional 5,10-methylenetetrahydrofolate dehydrogenase/5,10-methenyltetrahydrofolate cyclohydrolase, partial [Streptococcus salivarius]
SAAEVKEIGAAGHKPPKMVAILVGHDGGSETYVASKMKTGHELGFEDELIRFEDNVTEKELLDTIDRLNNDDSVDGFIVQLPLPKHIDEQKIIEAIDPNKDVDGFHPMNTGNLWNGRRQMVPCTPAGIMEILREYNVELEGKTAVIIGRSNIVGKPMAQLLLEKNATVTLTHSRTPHLAKVCRQADVLIVAIGRAKFVTEDYVKEGAVVIDVGINRDEEDKLCGDVDFDQVKDKVGMITPVPGGVGPMTITMLMEQTYQAALRSAKG